MYLYIYSRLPGSVELHKEPNVVIFSQHYTLLCMLFSAKFMDFDLTARLPISSYLSYSYHLDYPLPKACQYSPRNYRLWLWGGKLICNMDRRLLIAALWWTIYLLLISSVCCCNDCHYFTTANNDHKV